MSKFGIDVSKHQGKIDWVKVKPQIDFAIIRCGFGSDYKSQDDKCFTYNIEQCEKLGIPYGVYLYSYATNETKLISEIQHVLRLIKGLHPFCVYYDMEDKETTHLGKKKLTEYAIRFCTAMKSNGFKSGIYANQYWFNTYLDGLAISKDNNSIWCAKYSDTAPTIKPVIDIWQFTSKGKIDGIKGNVDLNYMFIDIIKKSVLKTNDEIITEVLQGKWGNGAERKEKLTKAGYDYLTIQTGVNERINKDNKTTKKTNEEIAKEVIKGLWGNGTEREQRLTKAGYDYGAIQKIVNKLV